MRRVECPAQHDRSSRCQSKLLRVLSEGSSPFIPTPLRPQGGHVPCRPHPVSCPRRCRASVRRREDPAECAEGRAQAGLRVWEDRPCASGPQGRPSGKLTSPRCAAPRCCWPASGVGNSRAAAGFAGSKVWAPRVPTSTCPSVWMGPRWGALPEVCAALASWAQLPWSLAFPSLVPVCS